MAVSRCRRLFFNLINDPRCNKVLNVITFCPKCNNNLPYLKLPITVITRISAALK